MSKPFIITKGWVTSRKMMGPGPESMGFDANPGDIWVSDFSDQSAKEFREKLQLASMMNPEYPIIVRINTYGGEADNLTSMISAIEEVPNPIITVGVGKIMSAGAILLSCGDFRFIDRNARVMIHQIQSFGMGGNITQVRTEYYETERLNDHLMTLMSNNCGFESVDQLLEIIMDEECYLEPEDAIAFGLVDTIGLPVLEMNVSYRLGVVPPKPNLIKEQEEEDVEVEASASKPAPKKKAKKTAKVDEGVYEVEYKEKVSPKETKKTPAKKKASTKKSAKKK